MKSRWEISALESGMLMAGAVSLSGHALAINHFIRAGGRDTWMSGIIAFPAALLSIYSWISLGRRFPGKNLVQYLPKVLGYAGYPVAGLYLIYFLSVLVFSMRMTSDWMVDSILPETPAAVISILYMAAVYYAASGGLDVLARINQLTLLLVTANGYLVMIGTLPAKDYRLLTPFFEFGLGPVINATLVSFGHFGEIAILPMVHAYVRPAERKRTFVIYFIALLYIVMVYTGPVAGLTATLGYRVAANMPYPTFQHWLMVSFARFFERTDLLAVHQWLAGGYVRAALYLLMVAEGGSHLIHKRNRSAWVLAVLATLVVATSHMAFPSKVVFDWWVDVFYLPFGGVIGVGLPPLLAAVAWLRNARSEGQGITHGA